jgi:hypothetical protein
MVAARFAASLLTSVVVGLLWSRVGREAWIDRVRPRPAEGDSRWVAFAATAREDFLQAGGWLVVGRWPRPPSRPWCRAACWTRLPATTCWPLPASAGGDPGGVFPPLPEPVGGAVPLPVSEFVTRALYDKDRTLAGARVRLLGFAAPRKDGG